MHKRTSAATFALVFAALAFHASGVWAQYPGGTSDRRGGMGGGSSAKRDAARKDRDDVPAPMSAAGLAELRLSELEDDLKLSTAQRPAWAAYRGQVMKLVNDLARAQAVMARESFNAVQQFDRIADQARNRLTAIEDIAEAGKSLYATLSPEQQALADRRLVLAVLPLSGGETSRNAARPMSAGAGDREGAGAGTKAGPGKSQ